MSTSFLIKVLSGTVFGSLTAGGVAFVVIKSGLISSSNLNNKNEIYVIAESTSISGKTKSSNDINNNNYFCQISEQNDQKDNECKITQINEDLLSKKFVTFQSITQSENKEITNDSISSDKKLFKIQVNKNFYNSIFSGSNAFSKNIEILKKETNNEYFLNLKPLFGIQNNVVYAKTNYSIGKVSSLTKKGITKNEEKNKVTVGSTAIKCNFIKESENGSDCKIYKLSDTNSGGVQEVLTNLTFSGTETTESNINKNYYYLYKFDTDSKLFSEFKSSGDIKVEFTTAQPTGEADDSSKIDQLNIENLIPAVVYESSNQKHIFLTK